MWKKQSRVIMGLALVLSMEVWPCAAIQKWALVVGVAKYPNARGAFTSLEAPTTDAEAFAQLLTSKYGFENITSLSDNEATCAGIRQAWQELSQQTQPGDVVVFYFSGHGTQVPDDNGDEEDRLDEALCPFDVGPEKPYQVIRDDEVRRWLDSLPTRNVTVVLECCHSGTGIKSVTTYYRARFIPHTFWRPQLPPPALPGQTPSPQPDPEPFRETAGHGAVLLAACETHEMAWEVGFPDESGVERPAGVFTHFLIQNLQAAPPTLTHQALIERVRQDVDLYLGKKFKTITQTPQLEGVPPERPLFGVRPNEVLATPFLLITGRDGPEVTLDGGFASGVTIGSRYTVFPAGTTDFTQERLGRLQVTRVLPTTATARVQEEQGQIKPGCRAVEIELGSRRLFARVQADGSPRLREAVLQALEALEYVQVVGPTDYADRLFAVQDKGPDCAGYLVTSDGEAGPTQAALDGEALVRQLQPALERAYALIKLAEMENPRPAFEVELWADRPVGQGYRIGEIATLHFRTSRDCHVTLLDVGTDGSVTVLFPNRFHVNNRVRAGQTYDIPSPAMGFRIRVHGPPGTEVVKAIATEQPLDLTHLSLKAVEAAFPRIEPVDEYAEELPEMIAAEQEAEGAEQTVPLAGWSSAAWVAGVRE